MTDGCIKRSIPLQDRSRIVCVSGALPEGHRGKPQKKRRSRKEQERRKQLIHFKRRQSSLWRLLERMMITTPTSVMTTEAIAR